MCPKKENGKKLCDAKMSTTPNLPHNPTLSLFFANAQKAESGNKSSSPRACAEAENEVQKVSKKKSIPPLSSFPTPLLEGDLWPASIFSRLFFASCTAVTLSGQRKKSSLLNLPPPSYKPPPQGVAKFGMHQSQKFYKKQKKVQRKNIHKVLSTNLLQVNQSKNCRMTPIVPKDPFWLKVSAEKKRAKGGRGEETNFALFFQSRL